MFIRETKTKSKKTNKTYSKYSLIESYRSENGPRQRTVMQLGSLSLPKDKWPMLAAELERRLSGQSLLIEVQDDLLSREADLAMEHYQFLESQSVEKQVLKSNQELVSIDIKSTTTSFNRTLGAELLAHQIFGQLNFPEILKSLGFNSIDRSLIEAIVLGRLIKPDNDLSTWRWMTHVSAVGELTEENIHSIKKDKVYEIVDELLLHKEAIEQALLKREKELFPRQHSLYLFDLTNLYFEGQCKKNSHAQFGKSKEKRNDCRLVSLALVVDSEGFPITSKIYDGNVGEPTTFKDILTQMDVISTKGQTELFSLKPSVVMDRGIATTDNLAYLKENLIPFIIIERSPRHLEYSHLLNDYQSTFIKIEREHSLPVWVHKIKEDSLSDSFQKYSKILCISEGKKLKEVAIKTRQTQRTEADLNALKSLIQKGLLKNIEKVNKKIGRLEERHPGLSKKYEIQLEKTEDKKNVITFNYTAKKTVSKENNTEDCQVISGSYLIETSHDDKSAEEIWKLYMTLTRVEAAFKSLKTDLGTRPIFHQNATRTEGHLFISILAYHLLIAIEYQLHQHGDQRKWTTIKEILQTHQSTTVIMTDSDGNVHHIRQASQPEPHHNDIYKKLNVKNPLKRTHQKILRRV